MRREAFRIGGFGRTDLPDAGPLSVLRQVGSAAFYAANRCHHVVDGPGEGAADTVVRSGDSGSPLIWEFAGRRFTLGAAQGFGADWRAGGILGDVRIGTPR